MSSQPSGGADQGPSAAGQPFDAALLTVLPGLRAFARSLCRAREAAEDLVHDTVVNMLASRDSFQPGTNFKAWAYTVMRNRFFNLRRRLEPGPLDAEQSSSHEAPQHAHMEVRDLARALWLLPLEQRQALMLVTVSGFSYQEAAQICGANVGAMKSRVSRARTRLAALLVASR